jgi:hypothetical protein
MRSTPTPQRPVLPTTPRDRPRRLRLRLRGRLVLDRGAELCHTATDIRKGAARSLMVEADLQRRQRIAGLRAQG